MSCLYVCSDGCLAWFFLTGPHREYVGWPLVAAASVCFATGLGLCLIALWLSLNVLSWRLAGSLLHCITAWGGLSLLACGLVIQSIMSIEANSTCCTPAPAYYGPNLPVRFE